MQTATWELVRLGSLDETADLEAAEQLVFIAVQALAGYGNTWQVLAAVAGAALCLLLTALPDQRTSRRPASFENMPGSRKDRPP